MDEQIYETSLQMKLLVKLHQAAAVAHFLSFIVLVTLLATGPSSSWPVTIPAYNGARVNWSSK
jgi:hypothetical protein